ncbi:hypothetical protein AKJ62_03310 [candidate division MSBL1 archaeon SCGC-AAA259D14]|uniref:CARDB domain-containing protein n=1 Tax=candidate division MSBL1 archaeon SCGC-AAA259D14 TaxID=1698261 RepID=A0A133U587_9EURY|nr:hypothetical protein AKJ62_03310 [candidate division MSBL1 archaeon SCGC-AAA259D14]
MFLLTVPAFFSNTATAWEKSAYISILGFSLFFLGWVASKIRSDYGRKYRDWTGFDIVVNMGLIFAMTLFYWLFSLAILRTNSSYLISKTSWPFSWFIGFSIALSAVGLYMGSIREGSWWNKKKVFGIILIFLVLFSFAWIYMFRSSHEAEVIGLELSPDRVARGDSVTVSLQIHYVAGWEGPIASLLQRNERVWSFTKRLLSKERVIDLKLNGETVLEERVNLNYGETKTVDFDIEMQELGDRSINIDNLTRNFKVLEPADLVVKNLEVDRERVKLGDTVSVYIDVKNVGGMEGTRTLELNAGEEIETKRVTISPGEDKRVSFSVSKHESGTYSLRIENLSSSFTVLKPATLEFSGLSVSENEVFMNGSVEVSVTVKNVGDLEGEKTVTLFLNGEPAKGKEVDLSPNQTGTVVFNLSEIPVGNYTVGVDNLSKTFNVVDPRDAPVQYLTYYYGTAENYVSKNYEIPDEKTVQGLAEFLHQIKLPEYVEDYFDCSDTSSVVEWLLEGAGFHAFVAMNYELGETEPYPHNWVMVELRDGELAAVEATLLTSGDIYSPPGIVIGPDGEFKKYSWEYERFMDWKEEHPPSEYDYDPDITLEEWKDEYVNQSIDSVGIPSREEYYSPAVKYESPKGLVEGEMVENAKYYMDESEFDWWNVSPFNRQEPFSKWE